jgi:GAF domain-containing protein
MVVQMSTNPTVEDDRLPRLGWLARRLERQPGVEVALRAVVEQARAADLADAVGVLIVKGRKIAVGAASDPDVRRADELQLNSGQGPGVEAILTRRNFISDDLRLDGRWRFWGPRAAAAGWLSVLTVALADGDTFASLNLYSRHVHSFNHADLALAEAFAAHAASALKQARDRPVPSAHKARPVGTGPGSVTQLRPNPGAWSC